MQLSCTDAFGSISLVAGTASGNIELTAGSTGTVNINNNNGISTASGTMLVGIIPNTEYEQISNTADCSPLTYGSAITASGAHTGTLADGVN